MLASSLDLLYSCTTLDTAPQYDTSSTTAQQSIQEHDTALAVTEMAMLHFLQLPPELCDMTHALAFRHNEAVELLCPTRPSHSSAD